MNRTLQSLCVYTLQVVTLITAPAARCFDLARSVHAHLRSASGTGERVVAGKMSGLLELGDQVTWEARHLGVRQRLTSQITKMDRPRYFQDQMVRGAFASFEHDHLFDEHQSGVTTMTDVLRFTAPLRPLGWLAERLMLARHLRGFIAERGSTLKTMAESDAWREFCMDSPGQT